MTKGSLPSPAQHRGIERAGDFDEARARRRMNPLQRMTNGVRADHAAFLHQDLGGLQAALALSLIHI